VSHLIAKQVRSCSLLPDLGLIKACSPVFLLSCVVNLTIPSIANAHDKHGHSGSIPSLDAISEEVLAEPSALAKRRLAAHADKMDAPQLLGQWSDVDDWPVLAVHANLLPTGDVLAWDATPDDFDDDPHTTDNYTTRVTVWDPSTNEHRMANNDTNADLFCAGSSQLWDGRVVFAGGDSGKQGRNGPLSNSSIYNPWTNTWTQTDHLNAPRWYSSVAPLSNGELLTLGGAYSPAPLAEVFQFNKKWRPLTAEAHHSISGDYSWLQTTSDGDVMYLGPHNTLSMLDTEGEGLWSAGPERDEISYRSYGSYAMFDTDRVLVSGGENAVRSAVVVDMATQSASATGSMVFGRRQHNLTLLADGTVLATGGYSSDKPLVDLDESIFTPEVWDPSTGEWSVLADMQRSRQYHAIALLLPDGRVLSAGGGYCGVCGEVGYHEQNAEIFSPPYLFDDNGEPAVRPTITYTPSHLDYRQTLAVRTPDADTISKVNLIKLGSVTHSQNQEQRLVELEFSQGTDILYINAPPNREQAPPGHYLLFLINGEGTPSHGEIIKIGQPLIQSDEVVVNSLRPDVWDHYEITGDGVHTLTVSLQGNVDEIDLYVDTGEPPSDPKKAHGFADCLATDNQPKRKICAVSAEQTTTWFLGVRTQNPQEHYSLVANADMFRPAATLPVKPGSIGAPATPRNMHANLKAYNHIELLWDRTDDNAVAGYEIWRDGELQDYTSGFTYEDKQLQADTIYSYQVAAVDDQQNRSFPTYPFLIKTSANPIQDLDSYYNPEIPTTPKNLRYDTYSPTVIELFWQRSIDNRGVAGYEVYKNNEMIMFGPGLSYFDDQIVAGNTYTYQVVAVDSDGNRSDPSNEVIVNQRSMSVQMAVQSEASDLVDVDGENSFLLTGQQASTSTSTEALTVISLESSSDTTQTTSTLGDAGEQPGDTLGIATGAGSVGWLLLGLLTTLSSTAWSRRQPAIERDLPVLPASQDPWGDPESQTPDQR
jgi:chitodextrinase